MSSRSFLDMFLDAASEADLDYSTLNENYCYTFILCHPENKIINTIRSPCLYHIHTRDLTTLNEVDVTIENDKIYKPKQYNTIKSKEDFASVMEMFVDYFGLGVIIKNSKGEMHM